MKLAMLGMALCVGLVAGAQIRGHEGAARSISPNMGVDEGGNFLLGGGVDALRPRLRRFSLHLQNCKFKQVFDELEKCPSIRIVHTTKYDTISIALLSADSATADQVIDRMLRGHPLVRSSYWVGNIFCIALVPSGAETAEVGYGALPADQLRARAGHIDVLPPATVKRIVETGLDPMKYVSFPGAHSAVGSAEIEREVSKDLLAHLDGHLSGLTMGGPLNGLGFSIRGNSTLMGTGTPLLVVGKFAYPGSIGDINIHDLSEATILKDAPAAGLWGAYSGNGVLVLTPREGAYDSPLVVTLTANTTWSGKPNLSAFPWMSSRSYINADSILFANHFFDQYFYDPNFPIPPSVRELNELRQGTIGAPAAQAAITAMGNHSLNDDLERYFYRGSLTQEYHLRLEGGDTGIRYYGGLGYEHDPTDLVRNGSQRVTAYGSFAFRSRDRRFEAAFVTGLTWVSKLNNNTGDVPVSYPYAALANGTGHPLAVTSGYNPYFVDTASGSYPLDWHYRPLQELALADNRSGRLNFYPQLSLTYRILPGLVLETSGRWMHGHSYTQENNNKDGFFVRSLVNMYSQQKGNDYVLPVPYANILVVADTNLVAYNLRGKLNFTHSWSKHKLSLMLGMEMSSAQTSGQTQRIYGHDSQTGSVLMDLANKYPVRPSGGLATIPTNDGLFGSSNHAVSVFANGMYSLKHGYYLSGGFRQDASNIVGIPEDRKWARFWSVGVVKDLRSDHGVNDSLAVSGTPGTLTADKTRIRPTSLKVRLSVGCNGNVSNRTASLTAEYLGLNYYGAPQYGIAHYPDPTLGWEKVYILNGGIDYGFFRDSIFPAGRLTGSLDVYERWSGNLLCVDSLPLSAGVSSEGIASGIGTYTGNGAGMIGQGIELSVHSLNVLNRRRTFYWTSDLLVSFNRDWVYKYPYQPLYASAYVTEGFAQRGKPSTSLYSYGWAGLRASDGSPQGYMGNSVSSNYSNLMYSPGGAMNSSGVWQPVVAASLMNSFHIGSWGISARFDCRTGYSVRRPSIDYYLLAMNSYRGTRDYDDRWQYAGQKTSVPSMPVVPDNNRDLFYQNSRVLVMRADNIRWRDLRLSYDVPVRRWLHMKEAEIYFYMGNISTVWKANHYGLNPDAVIYGQLPPPKTYSLGTQIKL